MIAVLNHLVERAPRLFGPHLEQRVPGHYPHRFQRAFVPQPRQRWNGGLIARLAQFSDEVTQMLVSRPAPLNSLELWPTPCLDLRLGEPLALIVAVTDAFWKIRRE